MSILFGILLFSFLIFIHELGHFVAAKASGVQVNEFALFMGPAILKWKRGETLYSIRCIPIGGYCAMEGEEEETENPRSFQKAAWWKRLIILVAGSFMNLVTGILLFAIVFAPAKKMVVPVIESIDPGCTIVREDGLHLGDRILEMDGEKIYFSSDFNMILTLNGGDVHDLVVERDGKKVALDNFLMEKHLFTEEDGTTSERFGFSFGVKELGFLEKADCAWRATLDSVRNVRLGLQMLLTGQAGLKDMGGPVMIVKTMSDVAADSETTGAAVWNLLDFGGMIAINLAVMNMLPIPALDGGRALGLVLTTGIEAVTRKKINPKYEGYIHGVGMILLLILMGVIMFKDIFAVFKG